MQNLLIDLDRELPSARRLLERYPSGNGEWRPHEKSRTLSALATHVAGIPHLGAIILTPLSWTPPLFRPRCPKDSAGELLEGSTRAGSRVLASEPRALLMRLRLVNHLVHHRAQLGVYLRLLDVPGIYGPSADEPM